VRLRRGCGTALGLGMKRKTLNVPNNKRSAVHQFVLFESSFGAGRDVLFRGELKGWCNRGERASCDRSIDRVRIDIYNREPQVLVPNIESC